VQRPLSAHNRATGLAKVSGDGIGGKHGWRTATLMGDDSGGGQLDGWRQWWAISGGRATTAVVVWW